MKFSVENITAQIEPVSYADGAWGFKVRYWLYGPTTATTYYQFQETFPTKAKMFSFARRAAKKHLRENAAEILRRLAKS